MEIFTCLALILTPAALALGSMGLKTPVRGKVATIAVWSVLGCFLWGGYQWMAAGSFPLQKWGFRIDSLNLMVCLFILFISGIVHLFSIRYIAGDEQFKSFFINLGLVTSSLLLMIGADHLGPMLFFWTASNLLLARLMIHKGAWTASRNSGILMVQRSAIGTGLIAIAIFILFYFAGTFSMHEILEHQSLVPDSMKWAVLLLIIGAALIQSGAWPFHKWLLSSLNSPTPVSGLMHAGLVNGGGLLLTRFAPLFSEARPVLDVLFVFGLISVVLGTFSKLVQNNIKGMLACSTMAQMGFMLMQCGLGLFSAAIVHLFLHGLFKCYLFLNSGSAITEHRPLAPSKSRLRYFAALLTGLAGGYGFALRMGFSINDGTTETVLLVFAWLASAQIAHSVLHQGPLLTKAALSSTASFVFGIIYGSTVYLFKSMAAPSGIDSILPLEPIHAVGIGVVLVVFLAVNLNLFDLLSSKRLYTHMLNFSQSDPKTITPIRIQYKHTR